MVSLDLVPVIRFSELGPKEQLTIASVLVERNKLVLTPSELVARILDNLLILSLFRNSYQNFVSVGFKKPSEMVIKAILANKASFRHPSLRRRDIADFVSKVEARAVVERGWATNSSGVHGAIKILESAFEFEIRAKGYNFADTFSLVVKDNKSGRNAAIEGGYLTIGSFRSPFSDNELLLNIFYGGAVR